MLKDLKRVLFKCSHYSKQSIDSVNSYQNTNSIFFIEVEEIIQILLGKDKKTWRAKVILKKKRKSWKYHSPRFLSMLLAPLLSQKGIERWTRIENPELKPNLYVSLWQRGQQYMGKDNHFDKWFWENCNGCMQKKN